MPSSSERNRVEWHGVQSALLKHSRNQRNSRKSSDGQSKLDQLFQMTREHQQKLIRHKEYLKGREEFQFMRALQNIEEGIGSDVDLRYAIERAPLYLAPLPEEEFKKRISHISGGNYSNADVIYLSTHYFLEGNTMGGQAIRRLLVEVRQEMTGLPVCQPGVPDIIDVALGNVFLESPIGKPPL